MFFLCLVAGMELDEAEKRSSVQIDETLFSRIGQSDVSAFEELYIVTERTLYSYALSLSGNHEVALDIMQDTYLKVRAAAHLYKPLGKPLAWLFTIARNLHTSRLRSAANKEAFPVEDIENNISFSYVSDSVDRMVLKAALEILSGEERQIVLLHAVSGIKHKELAETMSLPLSTVLSKYNRALKKLKSHLSKRGFL